MLLRRMQINRTLGISLPNCVQKCLQTPYVCYHQMYVVGEFTCMHKSRKRILKTHYLIIIVGEYRQNVLSPEKNVLHAFSALCYTIVFSLYNGNFFVAFHRQ